MDNPRFLTRVLRVLLAGIFVGVAAWFAPLVTAGGWRLFHPFGRVVYRGLTVRVPWPWMASDPQSEADDPSLTAQGLSLRKLPYTIDRRQTNESVFVTVISSDVGRPADQQEEQWLRMFRATHPGAAFDDKVPLAIPTAQCLSAQGGGGDRNDVLWTCISVDEGWVANFEGKSRDVPDFFRIVAGLKG